MFWNNSITGSSVNEYLGSLKMRLLNSKYLRLKPMQNSFLSFELYKNGLSRQQKYQVNAEAFHLIKQPDYAADHKNSSFFNNS